MSSEVLTLDAENWQTVSAQPDWVAALEAGKVLYFPRLSFEVAADERGVMRPDVLKAGVRNISLGIDGRVKGVEGDPTTATLIDGMMGRFRAQAVELIGRLLPGYTAALRLGQTSFRPTEVADRVQSWRADDRRLHVDAFPSRPNRGERILRVFCNLNPRGQPRIWRVGEPFECVARRFISQAPSYVPWRARALAALGVTKSLRSEYDHLMLQLHDAMKRDLDYQRTAPQITMPFAAGSTWICFSDQTSHAVMSGQFMMEQTLLLPAGREYDPLSSPLAVLQGLLGRPLVGASLAQ